jgi:ABC-type hemin transport system substrate-binding protein
MAVATLRRLLVDPLEHERLRRDVDLLVGVVEPMSLPPEVADLARKLGELGHRPDDGLQVARRAYVDALLAVMDDGEVEHRTLTFLANIAAGLAVVAGRDHEARRWIQVAEADAAADGLDGRATVLAWWRAVEIVAWDR